LPGTIEKGDADVVLGRALSIPIFLGKSGNIEIQCTFNLYSERLFSERIFDVLSAETVVKQFEPYTAVKKCLIVGESGGMGCECPFKRTSSFMEKGKNSEVWSLAARGYTKKVQDLIGYL
jgi:hypothetical protein